MKALGLGVLLMLSLSACSFPPQSHEAAPQTYRLAPVIAPSAAHSASAGKVLYVPEVAVNPALDSERITLLKAGLQQDFIAHSRWPDKLSRYLHASLLEALSQSGQFQAVSEQLLGKNNAYKLLLHVAHFEVDYADPALQTAAVEVMCEATLMRVADQHIVQQQSYRVRREGVPLSTSRLVEALNSAWSEALNHLIADVQ
ncbi:MAG: hypothetical protein RI964_1380 [Pseudomonadota bacterium]|jgi:ABC-type uncharacterized transport system auxiliary subunit